MPKQKTAESPGGQRPSRKRVSSPALPRKKKPAVSALSRAYKGLREVILDYEIKPGDRLNEVDLARKFSVSRTPLREALNRLAVERLLNFEPSVGYFRPTINLQEMVNLYELRLALESEGVRLAIERAGDEEIGELSRYWSDVNQDVHRKSKPELIADDELFHEKLVGLSHNDELVHALRAVNARIHFIRWSGTSAQARAREFYKEHLSLLDSIQKRDKEGSLEKLRKLIAKTRDEISMLLKDGAAQVYIK
jgi:DNA-binding GntR family transcriptional regulator